MLEEKQLLNEEGLETVGGGLRQKPFANNIEIQEGYCFNCHEETPWVKSPTGNTYYCSKCNQVVFP